VRIQSDGRSADRESVLLFTLRARRSRAHLLLRRGRAQPTLRVTSRAPRMGSQQRRPIELMVRLAIHFTDDVFHAVRLEIFRQITRASIN